MSRRLDPNGLAGAFAPDAPTALDFLVPPKAEEAPEPRPARKRATKKQPARRPSARRRKSEVAAAPASDVAVVSTPAPACDAAAGLTPAPASDVAAGFTPAPAPENGPSAVSAPAEARPFGTFHPWVPGAPPGPEPGRVERYLARPLEALVSRVLRRLLGA